MPAGPTFTIIVPTVGRPTLTNALDTVASQIGPGDIVIVDYNRDGDYGNRARNEAIERAFTTHLCFLDDDDEWLPGALEAMRAFVRSNPDRVGLFRARYDIWGDTEPTGSLAAVGTPMMVIPNVPGKVGRFGPADVNDKLIRAPRPGESPAELAAQFSDYEFLRSTLELRGDEPLWVPVITTVIRPEKSRWRRLRYALRTRSRLRRLTT